MDGLKAGLRDEDIRSQGRPKSACSPVRGGPRRGLCGQRLDGRPKGRLRDKEWYVRDALKRLQPVQGGPRRGLCGQRLDGPPKGRPER